MPTISQVRVSVPLTNLAIKYKLPNFVADKVFPRMPVSKDAGQYYVFDRAELDDYETLRGPASVSNEVTWTLSRETFLADKHSLSHVLADEVIDLADVAVRPRRRTVEVLTGILQTEWERRVQAIAQNVANVCGSATPATGWNAATGQTPEADVALAKETILTASGIMPNSILLNEQVENALLRYFKNNFFTDYKEAIAAWRLPDKLWNLNVVRAHARYNTAAKGQVAVYGRVWNDGVLVYYSEPSPSLEALSFGYTFTYKNFYVKQFRLDEREAWKYEVTHYQDECLTCSNCGYLILNTIQ